MAATSDRTLTEEPTRTLHLSEESDVALRDIGWKGYRTLLKLRGGRPRSRIVYLDGTAWLSSTTFSYERLAERLGYFVVIVAEELNLPFLPAGSTTFHRKKLAAGVEPTKSFYLTNAHRIQGNRDIHLRKDPPPDLVSEIVKSLDDDIAVEVYRRFGVPEVWVCEESAFTILILQPNGEYASSESSAAFPFLKSAEILEWVSRPQTTSETEWLKSLRQWVRDVLLARSQAAGAP